MSVSRVCPSRSSIINVSFVYLQAPCTTRVRQRCNLPGDFHILGACDRSTPWTTRHGIPLLIISLTLSLFLSLFLALLSPFPSCHGKREDASEEREISHSSGKRTLGTAPETILVIANPDVTAKHFNRASSPNVGSRRIRRWSWRITCANLLCP